LEGGLFQACFWMSDFGLLGLSLVNIVRRNSLIPMPAFRAFDLRRSATSAFEGDPLHSRLRHLYSLN